VADDPKPLHSAAWFGDDRDFWWNRDYLELIAARLRLSEVRSALDVGSGVGHWGMALGGVLSPEARVLGVEREAAWVDEARQRASAAGVADRFGYRTGVAEALPFDDGSFDLVTCQTLLIHVRDPEQVIGEMLRVARIGGTLLLAEPNNRVSLLVGSSASAAAPVDEQLDHLRFGMIVERGKIAVGEGDGSIGDLVPGMLAAAGAVGVQAWVVDKAAVMIPPYSTEEQQALRAAYVRDADRSGFGGTRQETRRYYLAGGGSADEFDAAWERRVAESARDAAAIEAGSFHAAGGTLHYIVAGRRPG
jgi:ubiquinone/menaquinone biosynthesis C-methylase UbiE